MIIKVYETAYTLNGARETRYDKKTIRDYNPFNNIQRCHFHSRNICKLSLTRNRVIQEGRRCHHMLITKHLGPAFLSIQDVPLAP